MPGRAAWGLLSTEVVRVPSRSCTVGTRWGEEAAGRRHWVVGGGLLNKLTASSPTQLGGQTPPQRGKGMWRVKPQYQVSLSAGHLSWSACCPGPLCWCGQWRKVPHCARHCSSYCSTHSSWGPAGVRPPPLSSWAPGPAGAMYINGITSWNNCAPHESRSWGSVSSVWLQCGTGRAGFLEAAVR